MARAAWIQATGKKLNKGQGRKIPLSKTSSHLMLKLPKRPRIAYTFTEVNFRKRRLKPMTDQERQRQMDFILEQQAQLTVSMSQLTDKVDRLSDKVDRTADSVNALLAIAEIHDQEIKATDERLNALVNVVERYVTGRTGHEGGVR
jgi:hypothetical protein